MAGFGYEIAPGKSDALTVLGKRLADLEDQLSQAKRLAEQRFRALADASPSMIWMAGTDALHTYFNPAWLEFRGRRLEEETGNGWKDGLHPEDRDLCLETHLKSFHARQRFRIQYRIMCSTGEYAWLESVGQPFLGENGEFAGFLGSASAGDHRRSYPAPDDNSVRMVFSLTDRERQVLVLIADGRSTKEAAAQLGISYKTADSHRSRILEKLGIHETASMVRYAIRSGLIAP
jgi:PAS domain S-box-containing protein